MKFFLFKSLDHPADEHRLTISKVAAQIALAQKVYGRCLGLDEASRENTLADLALMLSNQDLKRIDIDLIADGGQRILHQFSWEFHGDAVATGSVDHARANEFPVIDLTKVDSHRFVVHRHGHEGIYRHLLRINWSPAADLELVATTQTEAAHTSKITGGRVTGTLRVADTDRYKLRITRTGTKGYAFGQDLDHPLRSVFLHPKQATPGTQFRIGQVVTAVLVATPSGFQGKQIHTLLDD